LTETIQQIARDEGTFKKAKIVFTESDERCGLSAELDGVKKEGVPLSLDLEELAEAKTSAAARAQLKEALRLYFRKVLRPVDPTRITDWPSGERQPMPRARVPGHFLR
jgi:hypothetical protein